MILALATLAAALGPPVFEAQDVDTKVAIGYGVAVADVDGDGKDDIVLADKDAIAWYRWKSPGFEKHVIARKLTELDHVCVDARDLDGDGKAEIAAGAAWNPGDTTGSGSVHWLVAPADRAAPWEPIALPHEPTVHRMRLVRESTGFALLVAPLHGRGNVDAAGAGVKLQLYRGPADPRSPWAIETIDDSLHATHNIDPSNWDADPEDEILVASKEGLFLLDRGADGRWSRRALVSGGAESFPGASEARAGKLPGGKRFVASVEPFHGNRLMVAVEAGAAWKRKLLDEDLKEGHALACGDLLGLGHDQLVAGWRQKNAAGNVGVRLYVPRDATGEKWDRFAIDEAPAGMACEDLKLADLDRDGRLDVVASGRATGNLRVYWNRSSRE